MTLKNLTIIIITSFLISCSSNKKSDFSQLKEELDGQLEVLVKAIPEDKVSFWDFNDPNIPNTNRDASAAAIMASAFYELSTFSGTGSIYLDAANSIVESLTSENYRAKDGSNGGFLLRHSVGHKPGKSEIDVAINYADYYYLEALKRKHELNR